MVTTAAPVDRLLLRYAALSIAAALATMTVKGVAAALTGSVGLLSDALESGVNLVAAVVALAALATASRPPDRSHNFGHGKAEYLSAAVEGAMILVAAGAIGWTAIRRLLAPVEVDQAALGLALSLVAALVNLAVGLTLLRAGRRHRSVALLADGHHLLTDVWTSAGVVVGVAVVAVSGWQVLDPLIALLVGANILRIGYVLLRRSLVSLLDASLPGGDVAQVQAVVDRYRRDHGVGFGPLRTRESGRQRFVYVVLLVPGSWSVERSHALTEDLEADIGRALPGSVTFTHVEPLPQHSEPPPLGGTERASAGE